jgi:hypothetical protein
MLRSGFRHQIGASINLSEIEGPLPIMLSVIINPQGPRIPQFGRTGPSMQVGSRLF